MEKCEQHNELIKRINEMHGDIKVLVSEFKNMNGALRDTKARYDKHEEEGKDYRNKINILWSAIHTIKWAVGLLFGTGILFKLYELWIK